MQEGAYLKHNNRWYFAYPLEGEKYLLLAEAVVFCQGAEVRVIRAIPGKNDSDTIAKLLIYGLQNVRQVTELDPYLVTKINEVRVETNWQKVMWMLHRPEKIDRLSRELLWEALTLEFPENVGFDSFRVERIKSLKRRMDWGLSESKNFYDELQAEYGKAK